MVVPAGDRGAAGGAGPGPLGVHGPLRTGDDRQRADPDPTTWTASMHLVDLPDAQAARRLAFQEPCHRAGADTEVLVRR